MPVESCTAPAMDRQRERQYQIEDAARALQRAGEIAADPKLLKEAKAFAKKQVSQIDRIK